MFESFAEYMGLTIIFLSMVINLITIIRFTNKVEQRFTTLEVKQSQIIMPKIDDQEKRLRTIERRHNTRDFVPR